MKPKKSNKLELFIPDTSTELKIAFVNTKVSAGFPSPADDYIESKLDLNKYLIKHPSSTFFAKVTGDSMINSGIFEGDILVIDKSLEPKTNSILICFLDGEFTLKRIKKIDKDTIFLMPDNPKFDPIKVSKDNNLVIWGVVTYTIHKHY